MTLGVGPLCVAFIGERLDRRVAIAAASTMTVFCLLLLSGETTEVKYAAALFLLPLAFYFSISYMLAIVADVDYNGKVSSLMSFVLAVGAISGPPLFGYLRSINGPALEMMGVLLLVGAALMIAVQTSIQFFRKTREPGYLVYSTIKYRMWTLALAPVGYILASRKAEKPPKYLPKYNKRAKERRSRQSDSIISY